MSAGGAFRAADVRACVSGLSEEDGVHPQHPHGEEGEGPETGAAPRRSDGGELRLPLRFSQSSCQP